MNLFDRTSLGCLILGPFDTETVWGLLPTIDMELHALDTFTVPRAIAGTLTVGIYLCHTVKNYLLPYNH